MTSKLFCLTIILMLTACNPSPVQQTKEDAEQVAARLVFVKNKKTGLCFGVVGSNSFNAYGNSTSLSVTHVPCSSVESFLVEK